MVEGVRQRTSTGRVRIGMLRTRDLKTEARAMFAGRQGIRGPILNFLAEEAPLRPSPLKKEFGLGQYYFSKCS